MSAPGSRTRIISLMELSKFSPGLAIDASDSAAAVSRALAALSEIDLLRLQALARLRAHGLPDGVGWSDLLHEALARALDGSRQWPAGVPLLVFLSGVMRSIGNEIWRRRRREAGLIASTHDAECQSIACPAPDPERVLAAADAVAAIYRLFTGDQTAQRILSGLASGLSAEDIRRQHDLSSLAYDSARRRIRRTLLRAGLAGGSP